MSFSMTLYVAGPMTGLPDFNYPTFNRAQKALEAVGFEVLNPTLGQAFPIDDGTTWAEYMRRGLRMVLDAEGVALLPGWEESTGANLEKRTADALGILVEPLGTWIARGVL